MLKVSDVKMTPSENGTPDPIFDQGEMKIFLEQLQAENETISNLLKAHLFSEYYLDRLLGEYLGKKRDPVERLDLRFSQKLSLIDAFALLPQECVRSLRALNKVRNRCVHTFNTRPAIEDIRGVVSELPALTSMGTAIEKVPELLLTYMGFLFGYFSGAMHHLKGGKEH
jgi:hypothetical protein